MPLDALGGRDIASLADVLTELGVVPVPMAELNAHKAEQIRRNPPSIWFTHKPFLAVGLTSFAAALWFRYASVGSLSAGMIAAAFFLSLLVTAMFTLMAAIGFETLGIRLRGRAQWIECHPYGEPMPEPIKKVMQHVQHRLPRAHFVYGELVQKSQVLDPYLVVELRTGIAHALPQQACLGIWDDRGIIRIAMLID